MKSYINSLLLLAVAGANGQYFDFYQDPFFKPYQIDRNIQLTFDDLFTTKKPSVLNNNDYLNNNVRRTTRSSIEGLDRDENSSTTKRERGSRRKSTTNSIFNLNYYTSTVKPIRKTTKATSNYYNNGNSNNNSGNSRDERRKEASVISDSFNSRGPSYSIGDIFSTERTRTTKSYNNGNGNINNGNYYNNDDLISSYTTQRPYYSRPGVITPVVNGPPITNRPATRWPGFETTKRTTTRSYYEATRPTTRPTTSRSTTRRPTYSAKPDAIAFPGTTSATPNFIQGVDEDSLSDTEKRRYLELAEKMCNRYKAVNTKQLSAIPLIPQPEPVRVPVAACAPSTAPLVVGGNVADVRDFPHMALLGWRKIEEAGYSWKCGGSLISEQFVLTAAHCVYQERDQSVVAGPPRAVQLGSSYLDDPGALVVKISSIIKHPKYKLPKSYYDIALLKLAHSVTFSEVIKPACLGDAPRAGEKIVATGWGLTKYGGEQSLELRSVSIPVWERDKCTRILGSSRKIPNGVDARSQLCAGEPRGGRDTCQGDSGGPAMVPDGCTWRVVAVTSLGRSCGAPDTPGLYATVQKVFISAHIFGNVLEKTGTRIEDDDDNEGSDRYGGSNSGTNGNDKGGDSGNRYGNDNVNKNGGSYGSSNNDERNSANTGKRYGSNNNGGSNNGYSESSNSYQETTKKSYYGYNQDSDDGRQHNNGYVNEDANNVYNKRQSDRQDDGRNESRNNYGGYYDNSNRYGGNEYHTTANSYNGYRNFDVGRVWQ